MSVDGIGEGERKVGSENKVGGEEMGYEGNGKEGRRGKE